ncbi:hypothetical protein B7486_03910 [cyanobacterium TDX16]|nr:hypothetical protein B7486_03910 [cyanobacterium TDX16]
MAKRKYPPAMGAAAEAIMDNAAKDVTTCDGHFGGCISHRAIFPGVRAVLMVSGSRGSKTRPHSGQRFSVRPVRG